MTPGIAPPISAADAIPPSPQVPTFRHDGAPSPGVAPCVGSSAQQELTSIGFAS